MRGNRSSESTIAQANQCFMESLDVFLTRIGTMNRTYWITTAGELLPLLHWRRGLGRGGPVFFVIVILNLALNRCYALRFMESLDVF